MERFDLDGVTHNWYKLERLDYEKRIADNS